MSKYYELRPISDPPREDGVYALISSITGKVVATAPARGGIWLALPRTPTSHYLAPLAEPVEGMNFLTVLEENYEAIKSGEPEVLFPSMDKKAAVLETYEDLISIYKAKASSTPSAREAELEREVERLKSYPVLFADWLTDHFEYDDKHDKWEAFGGVLYTIQEAYELFKQQHNL